MKPLGRLRIGVIVVDTMVPFRRGEGEYIFLSGNPPINRVGYCFGGAAATAPPEDQCHLIRAARRLCIASIPSNGKATLAK